MQTASKAPASDLHLVHVDLPTAVENDVALVCRLHLASAESAAAVARRRSTEALRRKAGSHFTRAVEILKAASNG